MLNCLCRFDLSYMDVVNACFAGAKTGQSTNTMRAYNLVGINSDLPNTPVVESANAVGINSDLASELSYDH